MTTDWAAVGVGTDLPSQSFELRRETLVRYAGASGDFNPIHWNHEFAVSVGLPDVIAHGMLTMAEAVRVVTDWTGDPGSVLDYSVRFTRPIVVPDDGVGARLEVAGRVTARNEDGTVQVTLTATTGGQTVLGKAQAVVRLPG